VPWTPAAEADVVVHIDRASQRMSISVDGATRYNWATSTGRDGYGTPSGTFHARAMVRSYNTIEISTEAPIWGADTSDFNRSITLLRSEQIWCGGRECRASRPGCQALSLLWQRFCGVRAI